jgi:membrane protein
MAISLPRLTRRKALALAREIVDAFGEHRLLTYASAVAFRTLVALIPLTLLGIALLGSTGQRKIWERTLAPPIEKRVLPPVFAGIDATVQQILASDGALLIAFAAALALLDVSSAMRACMSALNEITNSKDKRPTWLRFAVSFALAMATIVCLVGAVLVVVAGGRIAGSTGGLAHFAFGVVRWLVGLVLLGTAIALVFRYGPYQSRSKTWVSAGSVAIIVTWVAASLAFKWFVSSVANYRTGPGILAAFLVLTTYVYVSSVIFLVGAQLNELVRVEARRKA